MQHSSIASLASIPEDPEPASPFVYTAVNLLAKLVKPLFDGFHPRTHPKFTEKDFFAEKIFYLGANPFDSHQMHSL